MPCPERARLLRLYAKAATDLSELVSKLAQSVATDPDIFDRAWEECETARHLCSQIQDQIYAHLRQHGCALDIGRPRRIP